jgi:hypothetical protein
LVLSGDSSCFAVESCDQYGPAERLKLMMLDRKECLECWFLCDWCVIKLLLAPQLRILYVYTNVIRMYSTKHYVMDVGNRIRQTGNACHLCGWINGSCNDEVCWRWGRGSCCQRCAALFCIRRALSRPCNRLLAR